MSNSTTKTTSKDVPPFPGPVINKVKFCQEFPAACSGTTRGGRRRPAGSPILPNPTDGDKVVDVPESVLSYAASLPPGTKVLNPQQWAELGNILLEEGLYRDAKAAGEISVSLATGAELKIQLQGMQLQADAFHKMGQIEKAKIAKKSVQHMQAVARLTEQLIAP